jgi:hypothetical protein
VNDDGIDLGHFRMSWMHEPLVNDRINCIMVMKVVV